MNIQQKFLTTILAGLIGHAAPAQLGSTTVAVAGPIGNASEYGAGAALGTSYLLANEVCLATCGLILPVTGLTLQAKRTNAAEVALNWVTVSEYRNKGFTIQRALGNVYDYADVGFVAGAGTATNKTRYKAKDLNDYEQTSYYRLQQTDLDGQLTYSNTVAVAGIIKNAVTIKPNPANNRCTVVLESIPNQMPLSIRLVDALGHTVWQKQWSTLNTRTIAIEGLQRLQPGSYFAIISTKAWVRYHKLMIAR